MNILIFGDNIGIPQLLSHIPTENLVGIVCASIRPEYHNELLETAKSQGLPLLIQPLVTSPDYQMFGQMIGQLMPDLIFVNSYSMIIREDILAIPRFGGINIHGALLPKYRGCNPTQWAIMNGETSTGSTLHEITRGIDEGPIIAQKEVPLYFEDTWKSVYDRLAKATDDLVSTNLDTLLTGQWKLKKQNGYDANYCRRRTPDDSFFLWTDPVIDIYNKVRALLPPLPPAFYVNPKGIKVQIKEQLTPWEITSLKYKQMVPGASFGTVQIRVRTVVREDVSLLARLLNNRELTIFNSSHCPINARDKEDWIESVLAKRFDLILFVIEEISNDKAIGVFSLTDINWLCRNAELQININDKHYHDSELAYEAIQTICNFGFKELKLNAIYVKISNTNKGLTHAFRKSGFKREGLLDDAAIIDEKRAGVLVLYLYKDK